MLSSSAASPPVSVVVPWRDSPGRAVVWEWLQARWEAHHPDWQLVTGTCPDGPWRKAVAVADALTRADGDVLVVADADVWCDGVSVAVDAVIGGARWAIPHQRLHRLTELATAAVLDGQPWPRRDPAAYTQRPYTGRPGGGIVVMTRAMYERVPIDPRFGGWGHEDEAWALALYCLAGRPHRQ